MNNEYIKVIFLGFIFVIHIGVLNIIEKILMKKLINNTTITNRPLDKCINSNDFDISCIGMPSGHTESATIISLLLHHYDLLPLPMAILTIIVVGLQRVTSKMHTIQQVLVGLLFGIGYTQFYINNF